MKPRSITKKLRFDVLIRDGFKCRYCGSPASDTVLHVDHVVPVALGGRPDMSNLATACIACNAGKSDRLMPGDHEQGQAEDSVQRVYTAPIRDQRIAPLPVSKVERERIISAATKLRESISEFMRAAALTRVASTESEYPSDDFTCASIETEAS